MFDINIKFYDLLLLGPPGFCVFSKIMWNNSISVPFEFGEFRGEFLPDTYIFNQFYFWQEVLPAHCESVAES